MNEDDAIQLATALLDKEITHYLQSYCDFLDIFDLNGHCTPTVDDLLIALTISGAAAAIHADDNDELLIEVHDIRGQAAMLIYHDLLTWDGLI